MRRITTEPLTAEAFAPFGEVLESPAAPGRAYMDKMLENRRSGAAPSLSFTRALPKSAPFASTTMERHEFSSQSFIPMKAGRWLALVAPHGADGKPDMAKARAFLARPDQGVTYGANVWHHPFTAFDCEARFAVFMWKDGTSADDEFVEVQPFELHLR